jgi:hypothetical protein
VINVTCAVSGQSTVVTGLLTDLYNLKQPARTIELTWLPIPATARRVWSGATPVTRTVIQAKNAPVAWKHGTLEKMPSSRSIAPLEEFSLRYPGAAV